MSKPVEIIKDKLFWLADKNPPKNQPNAFFFNIDSDLVYEPFFADFGPLDLGKLYRFVTELEKLVTDPKYAKSKFYHHTSMDTAKRANSAYLMGAYQVLILNKTADEAWEPFANLQPAFTDFRDASYTHCTYKCSILHCLRGLEYAIKLKWFDMKTFDLREYEYYEKVDNGDLNWIIPGKFVAFSGPSSQNRDPDGYRRFTPEDYVPIFKKLGVTTVIRLNNKQYESARFTKAGIKHHDLYFLDGSCPSDQIIDKFLEIVEQEKGAVAVHCKAGLGRTGSLIAAYAMKHYKFPAPDFIGWIRICRPGSILGPQQQFLCDKEKSFHQLSANSAIYKSIQENVKEVWNRKEGRVSTGIEKSATEEQQPMTPLEQKIAVFGDHGQANRLLNAKYKGKVAADICSLDEIPTDDNFSIGKVPTDNEFLFRGGKIPAKAFSGHSGSSVTSSQNTTLGSPISPHKQKPLTVNLG